ncbi:hypothetical protein ACQB60_15765 [Actinomycetota bacterium Odt1-20B]
MELAEGPLNVYDLISHIFRLAGHRAYRDPRATRKAALRMSESDAHHVARMKDLIYSMRRQGQLVAHYRRVYATHAVKVPQPVDRGSQYYLATAAQWKQWEQQLPFTVLGVATEDAFSVTHIIEGHLTEPQRVIPRAGAVCAELAAHSVSDAERAALALWDEPS